MVSFVTWRSLEHSFLPCDRRADVLLTGLITPTASASLSGDSAITSASEEMKCNLCL